MTEDSSTLVAVEKQGKEFTGNQKHLDNFRVLLQTTGVKGWNEYRKKHPRKKINLSGINLRSLELGGIDLHKVDLTGASFTNTHMWEANLAQAILINANLDNAKLLYASLFDCKLINARLVWTDLTMAHMEKAKLNSANMSYANLSGVKLQGATLTGAWVTGTNVWGIETDATTIQDNLVIESFIDPLEEFVDAGNDAYDDIIIKVDNIETAHLLYLVTRRERDEKNRPVKRDKLKDIIDTMTEKVVLVLGNFGIQRKSVLNVIRFKLAELGYAPVIFDFTVPKDRDLIETVAILAGLSRFVIADFSAPRSTPLEALLIISGFKVPFAPIISDKHEVFSMFNALQAKYDWVLAPVTYKSKEGLKRQLKARVIVPCENMRKRIDSRRKKIDVT